MRADNVVFSYGGATYVASGYYTPGLPGRYSGPPERCYPDEPSEFDVDTLHIREDDDTLTDASHILQAPHGQIAQHYPLYEAATRAADEIWARRNAQEY